MIQRKIHLKGRVPAKLYHGSYQIPRGLYRDGQWIEIANGYYQFNQPALIPDGCYRDGVNYPVVYASSDVEGYGSVYFVAGMLVYNDASLQGISYTNTIPSSTKDVDTVLDGSGDLHNAFSALRGTDATLSGLGALQGVTGRYRATEGLLNGYGTTLSNAYRNQYAQAYLEGLSMFEATPELDSKVKALFVSNDITLKRVDVEDGSTLFTLTMPAAVWGLATDTDNNVYVSMVNRYIQKLDVDGNNIWTSDLLPVTPSKIALGPDNSVYWVNGSGHYGKVDPDGTIAWSQSNAGNKIDLAVSFDDRVYLLVKDSTIRSYIREVSASTGSQIQATSGSHVVAGNSLVMCLSSDSSMLITSIARSIQVNDADYLNKVNTSSNLLTTSINSISAKEDSQLFVVGNAGNLIRSWNAATNSWRAISPLATPAPPQRLLVSALPSILEGTYYDELVTVNSDEFVEYYHSYEDLGLIRLGLKWKVEVFPSVSAADTRIASYPVISTFPGAWEP